MKVRRCYNCGQPANKDVVALNQKLLGRSVNRVLCIKCLAEYLECTEEELLDRIKQFKEEGCALFADDNVS
ncbi:MAG: hypothetical protein IMF26_06640 [Candidatus Fermentithermobacillus carboniphilus]|uniref:ClpX-type ZB domain-containing protein n=1 Tax=Candidatus Fermentithermobacillus carboniphilus TaxID=3085328 RepID=A0AAT9LAG5_9FIRM|nr:MAG: hypothetical protein IMF26_06640 [Candidatus Fermentithermobacillus carboniphilus]